MNIYKVGISNNLQVVGTTSQIRSFLQPFEYRGPNSFTNIGKYKNISFKVEFPVFEMMHSAKRTDIINNTPLGSSFIVLSNKAFDILSLSLNFDEYQDFTIRVLHKKEMLECKAIHFLQERVSEFVDWQNSTFAICGEYIYEEGKSGYRPEFEVIHCKNYGDFLYKLRNPTSNDKGIVPKNIKLVNDIPYDLFYCPYPVINGGYLCSEKFKDVVEKNKLTGFQFIPFEESI